MSLEKLDGVVDGGFLEDSVLLVFIILIFLIVNVNISDVYFIE